MKYRVGIAVAMVVGFLTIIAASCGGDGTPSPSPTPTASSEPLPTLVPAVPLPTPTSVPTELRRMALQLAISHGRISASWEQLHLDFDTWRQGLISCDVSSVQGQLAQFAADTVIIATSAQDLPRLASVRELADQVLEVIQAETRVMAGLRDRWHGGNSGAFQEFDSIHSVVIQTLQEVDDAIQDLKERSSVDARAEAGAFVREFGQLSSFWDSFYASYDAFRGETLTSSQAVSILNDLVDDLQNVLLTARDLPDEPALRPVVQLLVSTAEEEALVIRQIMDSSQDLGESVFVAEDPALFGTFDALVVLGANKRRQVTELLNDILRETSQESNDAALALEESLLAVTNLWNEFHREYAQWRSTQEGCDRLAAVETLGTFSVRFGELAASARTLPSLTVMRPLVELLVEAAEQEGDAMRQLRDSWVPFDTRVYARYDQKRNEASRLRRQVSSSLSALLPEYGISAQEVTS